MRQTRTLNRRTAMLHGGKLLIAVATTLAAVVPHHARAQTTGGDGGSRVPTMAALGMGAGFVGLLGSIEVAEATGGVAAQIGGEGARRTGELFGLVGVQPIATAWGVHVGNKRRGSAGKAVLASYAATAATGVVAAAIANARGQSLQTYTTDNLGFFLTGIAAQTIAAIVVERATTR